MEVNILEFNGVMHTVVGDIPVDSETHVVTRQSRGFAGSVFEDAHKGRICVRMFIGVRVCVRCECLSLYCVI